MKIRIFQKIQRSLFIKIVLTFLASYIVFTASQALLFRYLFKSAHFIQIQQNSSNYANYIVNEIGTPPDTLIAKRVALKNGIGIRIEGPDLNWKSTNDMREFDEINISEFDKEKNIRVGFDKGLFVDIEINDIHYLFAMERREEGFKYRMELNLFISLFFTTLFLFIIYLVLRWQLNPIRTLHKGITKLSKGDFDLQIETDRHDELGQLIHSVNDMIRSIKERIHARDQLLLDVSHELRSPLTRTKVALEFLEDENVKKNITEDITEMETMITEILETERLKSSHGGVQLQKINLNQIIKEVISEFSDRQPGLKILNLPDSIIINGDAERIRILLRNIIDNALKYSKQDNYPVEVSLREKSDELTIEVQDFGQGIPEKEIPFVFEPFYRVDKSRSKETGGYGLGMNMSRQIMEAHGGTIDISSKLNVGTTVYLKFKK
ncbi:MAG: HAMP domain-containing histidine kinase [Calditrichaeota bacterium]|nr:HAMP domain-containing histidine kinase [Calditrichota bacterium]